MEKALTLVAERRFQRLTYADAISILNSSGRLFDYPVTDGLSCIWNTKVSGRRAFPVPGRLDHPLQAKPFYMRVNDDGRDGLAAMMLLVRASRISAVHSARTSDVLETCRSHGVRDGILLVVT